MLKTNKQTLLDCMWIPKNHFTNKQTKTPHSSFISQKSIMVSSKPKAQIFLSYSFSSYFEHDLLFPPLKNMFLVWESMLSQWDDLGVNLRKFPNLWSICKSWVRSSSAHFGRGDGLYLLCFIQFSKWYDSMKVKPTGN